MSRFAKRIFAAVILGTMAVAAEAVPRFAVTYPAEMSAEPVSGRLLLIFSPKGEGEPREQVIWDGDAIPFFGLDVESWKPGKRKLFNRKSAGFPIRSLEDLPAGEYRVQAVLNRYERFTRSDGRKLMLPPDQGEGQAWSRKPGNLYSKPQTVRIEPRGGGRVKLVLDQKIPPVEVFEKKQTEYVRYLQIRSERLSKFWGRDVYLAAWVRLPWGYDTHPEARYPLVIDARAFPGRARRIPRDAAGSRPQAGLQQALSARRLQPHPAGIRVAVASGLDHDRISRACCSSRSSTRRLITTIPMR